MGLEDLNFLGFAQKLEMVEIDHPLEFFDG